MTIKALEQIDFPSRASILAILIPMPDESPPNSFGHGVMEYFECLNCQGLTRGFGIDCLPLMLTKNPEGAERESEKHS